MRKCAVLVMLVVAGLAMILERAAAQQPVQLAFADPQPHFVAAWAPKKERAAERAAVLVRRVSLELADVSLDAALKALTERAGLRITYSPAVLPSDRHVTISARDVAVVTALTEMLFRSGLDVVVGRDGAMALVRCRHEGREMEVPDSGVIVGVVTDQATGEPIAGASVAIDGARGSSTTDEAGQYRISNLEAGSYTVRARYIGFAPASSTVTVPSSGQAILDFALAKSAQQLDELVTVTPGGIQTQVRALPTPVSVVSADDIERQRPQALLEVVRQAVPGAVSFFAPSRPDATNFSTRGATSLSGLGTMKIFIDGVEASAFGSSAVDPASIERIEVVRGPQAATLYGADAAGGVVQIFTKRGDPELQRPQADLQVQAGIVQTPYDGFGGVLRQQYGGSVRGGDREVSYNVGAGYTRLGDWLPDGELSRQASPSVYGGIKYDRGIINADLQGRFLRNQIAGGSNPQLLKAGFVPFSRPSYPDQEVTNETYGARITISPRTWWRTHLTMGVDRLSAANVQDQRRLTTPEDTLFQIFEQDQRKVSTGISTSLNGPLSRDVAGSLTVGFDHYRLDANFFFTSQALNTEGTIETSPPGSITGSRSRTTNTGYFAQTEVGWRDAVFLTAGIRAEDNSSFGEDLGTPVLPRVGIAYVKRLGVSAVKLRGAYGRAIRAPSPGQTTGGTTALQINLPNRLLGPEQQFGWEGGIDLLVADRATIGLTAYTQVAKDLISFQQLASLPLPTFQFQNIGRVANRGAEVEVSLRLSGVTIKGQYAYTHSRVEDLGPGVPPGSQIEVGDRPLGLPTHTGGMALTLTPRTGTYVTAGVTYVGGFRQLDLLGLLRCFGGTGPCQATFREYIIEYPGFAKLNIGVNQRITRQIEGVLSVNNLANNLAYEGSNSQAVMGRTTMIGARIIY